jgi:IS30 family transposase
MLAKVKDRRTDTVIAALIKHSQKLPIELYKSLTWDRGAELAGHKNFTLATDIATHFCEPSSPWQRGSNENTNRLLRQYFPKGTDLSIHSQSKLSAVARQLNERPRKTLECETCTQTSVVICVRAQLFVRFFLFDTQLQQQISLQPQLRLHPAY